MAYKGKVTVQRGQLCGVHTCLQSRALRPDVTCPPGQLRNAWADRTGICVMTRAGQQGFGEPPCPMPPVHAAVLAPTCCVHGNQVSRELHAGEQVSARCAASVKQQCRCASTPQQVLRDRPPGRALQGVPMRASASLWSAVPEKQRGSTAGLAAVHLTSLHGVLMQPDPAHRTLAGGPNQSSPDIQSGSSCPSRACSKEPGKHHPQL